jgi:nucleoside diphosphate kinase
MFITAMKVMQLSVEEAQRFYALKIPQFREQLKGMVAERARRIVQRARALADQAVQRLGANPSAALNLSNALTVAQEAERLFDTRPTAGEAKPEVVARVFCELRARLTSLQPPQSTYDEIAEALKEENARAEFNELIRYMTGKDPATGKPVRAGEETHCMALLYSGPNALSAIRKRLKELREVYGQNILLNRAHASDPEEDPLTEMQLLGMPTAGRSESRPCDVERVVDEFYGPQ